MSTVESDMEPRSERAREVAVSAPLGRAPRISQADVFEAADALLVEGHRPTIDRVRMRLGRGSPNTINDHLDSWWAKLGSRLRDLPGREFPRLPERVAQTLQQLWNEALEGAHEAMQGALLNREQNVLEREQVLEVQAGQLAEREQATAARMTALEESLALAREQLGAANRRAETLEGALAERDATHLRLRTRNDTLEAESQELRVKMDASHAAHQSEREALQQRHEANEARWLAEVDRARHQLKESERGARDVAARLQRSKEECAELKSGIRTVRQQMQAAEAVKSRLQNELEVLRLPARASDRGRKEGSRAPRQQQGGQRAAGASKSTRKRSKGV